MGHKLPGPPKLCAFVSSWETLWRLIQHSSCQGRNYKNKLGLSMYSALLAQRAAENRPIRVGIIGTGKFGGGVVAQLSQVRGMEVAVIAEVNAERARHAYTVAGRLPGDALRVAK